MNKRNVILCIDDEVIVLDSLKEQLQTEYNNYMIEVAESGEEAMEIINELI
jgi:CheY-like chemotaxis protein